MSRFDEKVALVTGAASGIGRETALRLAREGAAVVVADIQEESGDKVVAEIKEASGRAIFFNLDVASEEAWAESIHKTESEFGGLNILVNNAGIGDNDPIEVTSKATYDRVIAIT